MGSITVQYICSTKNCNQVGSYVVANQWSVNSENQSTKIVLKVLNLIKSFYDIKKLSQENEPLFFHVNWKDIKLGMNNKLKYQIRLNEYQNNETVIIVKIKSISPNNVVKFKGKNTSI